MLINLAPFQIKFKPMTVENCFLYIEGLNLDKKGEKKKKSTHKQSLAYSKVVYTLFTL